MKKNILVGSIIAVVILIGISFTSVIGYRSIRSESMNTSPLFEVRTNRVIGEESKVIHCQYASKGITLWFPNQDDKAILKQQVVESIRKIDKKTFERFIASVIVSIQKNDRLNDVNPDDIRDVLYLIRDSDESVIPFNIDTKYNTPFQTIITPNCPTSMMCESTIGYGVKCFLACSWYLIFCICFLIALILEGSIPTPFICTPDNSQG